LTHHTMTKNTLQKTHAAIDESFSEHVERCLAFLRQKSISATGEGVRETAQMVKAFIEEIGGEVVFWGDPSAPIVFGRLDKGAPRTLIIYGMYDVQPADEPTWMSPPFAAEIHNLQGLGECVIARGSMNSKGVLCGLFNALKTMAETDKIPLNLIFTIEGEEEIGSPQLEDFIQTNKGQLAADGMADFDFSQNSRGKVSMHLGLKGIVYLDLVCRGGKRGGPTETSLHGADSAWVASPVWRLIHALSSLTDNKENIRIPGFYDTVAPPSQQDVRLLKKLAETFDERSFLKEMKSICFKYKRHGVDLLKKGLYLPILNIDGFRAGYSGPGTKTVLPRRATAKIDIRFGPNMEPEEVVEKLRRYLLDQGFDDIEVRVRDNYPWSKTDFSESIVQQMLGAYRLHGVEPEIWPMATWTAPYFVYSRILRLPVAVGGLGHGGRPHAANEYMRVAGLKDFEKFAATFLYLMAEESTPQEGQSLQSSGQPAAPIG
jgi:acetylornithine deacetylase/succinyl-diaminopimelate desuccinylase-like protein